MFETPKFVILALRAKTILETLPSLQAHAPSSRNSLESCDERVMKCVSIL